MKSLVLRTDGEMEAIPFDHPRLQDGWWAPEWHDRTDLRRWTDGNAALPIQTAGPAILEVDIDASVVYPVTLVPAIACRATA